MRIIAGKLRRRKLRSNRGLTTRPITDRVKEVLFENMGGEFHGERVADIFAGTGTLGLEAISRGAASCVFMEKDTRARRLLLENVEALGVADQSLCWQVDVLHTSFLPKGVSAFLPYDVIFLDPPYRMIGSLETGSRFFRSLERLARPNVSRLGATLVFRVPEHSEFSVPDAWKLQWSLPISAMELHVYESLPAAGIEHEPRQRPQDRHSP